MEFLNERKNLRLVILLLSLVAVVLILYGIFSLSNLIDLRIYFWGTIPFLLLIILISRTRFEKYLLHIVVVLVSIFILTSFFPICNDRVQYLSGGKCFNVADLIFFITGIPGFFIHYHFCQLGIDWGCFEFPEPNEIINGILSLLANV